MKKAALWLLALSMLVGALSVPAAAKKKKKAPPPPQPVPVVLYLHGDQPVGELEIVDALSAGTYMTMDTTEGSSAKSFPMVNGGATPNMQCAGNAFFPNWIGDVSGTIVGDVKVTFGTTSTPGDVLVRLWPDVVGQACNDTYIEPAREGTVAAGGGQATNEIVLSGLDFTPTVKLLLQINPVIGGTAFGRFDYDTPDAKVEFMCIPPAGSTTCAPA